MVATLLPMFALIGIGLLWSWWRPGESDPEAIRRLLTSAVYHLFLPALVLRLLWQAPLGLDSIRIIAAAGSGVLVAVAASMIICRALRVPAATAGAMILAASWPNATYLGLPVLQNLYGDWAANVAIQYDLFACTPLLLTVGTLIANAYGSGGRWVNPLPVLTRVPPLWAALAAVLLNVVNVPLPAWLDAALALMGSAVVPLMLLSVGMALTRGLLALKHLPLTLPVALVQLLLMPLVVWGVATAVGLYGDQRVAVVLEGAMPSMVLGIVIADRHGLNTGVYAAALTVTTLLAFITLPFWASWMQS
jgi:malate permease and related proteins